MRIVSTTIMVAILSVLPLAQAWAQEANEPVQRVCKNEDFVGHVYKMVDFHETPPRQETQFLKRFPYDYLAFRADNTYRLIASNVELLKPKRLYAMLRSKPGSNDYYTLSNDGILNLIENDKLRYSYRCITMIKSYNTYMKDDLILTGYTRKGKSQMYKLYRRWY